jgi:hypothetical protein
VYAAATAIASLTAGQIRDLGTLPALIIVVCHCLPLPSCTSGGLVPLGQESNRQPAVLEPESKQHASIRRMSARVVAARWCPHNHQSCAARCRRESSVRGSFMVAIPGAAVHRHMLIWSFGEPYPLVNADD